MTRQLSSSILLSATVAGLIAMAPIGAAAQDRSAPLLLTAGRVTIHGTSNMHEFTASTTDVRLTWIALADGVSGLNAIKDPGAVEAFEIAIDAASLSTQVEGLDRDLHAALKTADHPDIMFRLTRLEALPDAAPGTLRATGLLAIAGVEKAVAFDLKTAVTGATLTVSGDVPVLMTDFGITPPTAVLGLLKANPKILVTFDTVLTIPTTF